MGQRLIDVDKLLKNLDLYINRSSFGEITIRTELSLGEIYFLINVQPIVSVGSVKHGKWIEKPFLIGTSNFCSVCGENFGSRYKYCPMCGAKMMEESKNERI